MNDLTLGLRIRVNDDGSVQVLNQTGASIKRVSTEAQNVSHNMSDMARALSTAGEKGSASAQRITAGMSSASSAAQVTARSIYETAGSITSGMASAATSTQISAASIANSLRQASSVGRASMQSMTESMVVNLHTISATLTALDARLAATEAQTVGTMAASTSATTSAAAGFAKLKGIVATLGLGMLAKDVLDTNRNFESLRMQLNGVMGSAAAGAMAFDESMKWAVKTPFELKDITQAFITLKNFGIDPTSSTMESITNQAARLGKGAQGLTTLTMQLGQAWTKGKLQMQDMHIMMEAGVPVIDMLKTVTGKTGAEIADMSEKGDLGRESIKGLIDEMGRLTAGSNAAAMQTLNGQISNLSDAWHNFEDTLLQDKSEGLIKSIVASMTESMNLVTRNMSSSVDAQIAHSEARIKTLNSMGVVGSFLSDMTGSDANLEKNRLAGLKRIKTAQDEANKLITINKDSALAIKDTWEWLAEIESADAEKSDKLAKEKAKKAKSEAESAAKSLQSAYDNAVNSLEKEISMRGSATKSAAMEYEVTAGSLAKLTEAQKLKLLQDAAEVDNQALLKQSGDAQKSRMDALVDKYNQLTMSARDYYATTLKDKNGKALSPELVAPLVQQFDKNSAAEASKKSVDEARSALESYNKTVADTSAKTSDLGSVTSAVFDGALGGVNTLAGAFDNMINSIDKSTAALEVNRKAKIDIDKFQPATDKGLEQYLKEVKLKQDALSKNAKDELKYNSEIVHEKLSGTRQIAGAVSSMLKQGSTEQRAAHAIEMGLAGAQIAMQFMKITGIGAVSAAETASVAPSVTASTIKGEAKAAEAVATQASAGPYIGFALMAAMAAAMAALGFMGGKSSVSSMGAQGMSPTSGTVLGNSSAQSESIDKTYQLLKDIHAEEYATLRSIDKGIADLHGGITDVITRLYQAGGLASVDAPASAMTGVAANMSMINLTLGGPIGIMAEIAKKLPVIGGIVNGIENFIVGGIFGGKQTSNVTAQGIATSPTSIMDIIAGQNLRAQQFAQIETKTDGGWFGKDKFSFRTVYSELDNATQKALNDVFRSMGSTMLGLADNLGHGLEDRVTHYIIPALTVDLKGLDGEAAAKKLNGVLSTALDTMSTTVFGDLLGQYQQLGEGMLETAVRVASEIAVVKDSLSKSGLSIAGDAIAISDGLAQAAGGIKEFQKQFDSYYQKFHTDAERNVFTQKQLASQLSDVNLLLPATRDGYRQVIEALNINNAADQERYSLLIKLSGAADTYYTGVENAAKAAQQIADQQRSLDIQLMEASGNAIGALTEKRKDELAAMDASLRFGQQSVWAVNAANAAIDNAMTTLKKSVSDQKALNNTAYQSALSANNLQKDAANNLLSALKTVASNLKSALVSTIVESDNFSRQRRLSAQSVLQSALLSANAGGSLSNYAGLDQALIDIAKPSENLFVSFTDYARDQGRTGNVIAGLADHATTQISVAEQTLNAIEASNTALTDGFNAENNRLDALVNNGQAQIDAINGTTANVMSVNDAVTTLAYVINAKMATEAAIANAQKATKAEASAKSQSDATAAQAAASAQKVTDAMAAADKAAQAASAAQAAASAPIAQAPNTFVNGQSGNPIWERILSAFNADHAAHYGMPMNRAWTTDADAQAQYQILVAQYNSAAASSAASARANAAGLAAIAAAQAALIPGYQATAAADQAAANQAAAAYSTASAYATAAKNAVPGINSFEVGTNYVTEQRWAQIHPGERIMPAADNRELMMRLSEPAPSNNSEMVAEIRRLNGVVVKLQSELEKITKNTGDTRVNTGDMATVLKKCTLGGDSVRTNAV